MLETENISSKFVDFLRECLMFSPSERPRPFDLLSHPIFRKYNKVYVSQQVPMTYPVTRVEKNQLQKMRNSGQDEIKIKQLLEIIKLKVKYEKQMSFQQFLVKSFSQL